MDGTRTNAGPCIPAVGAAPADADTAPAAPPRRPRLSPILAAVLLVAAAALVAALFFHRSARTRLLCMDDPAWFNRSVRLPLHCRDEADYRACVDVPALNRWLYGAALRITGAHRLHARVAYEEPTVIGGEHASMHLWLLPRPASLTLRAVNSIVFAAFLALLYLCARCARLPAPLAALAILPLALSPALLVVSYRIAPDPFLACALALTLFAWMRLDAANRALSWTGVALVSAAAGLAASAKLNGALALLAFCAFLAIRASGRARLTKPLLACAVAFAIFSLVNPVMLFSLRPPWIVVADFLARRLEVIAHVDAAYGTYSRGEILARSLPFAAWLLMPAMLAAQFLALKRFAWMLPVALWGAFLWPVTLLTINHPVHWYVAPAQIGLYFPSALAFAALARRFLADNLSLPAALRL